ncbi:MAG: class I SAM-dependent methyltransferase [Actinomycetota bacterium]
MALGLLRHLVSPSRRDELTAVRDAFRRVEGWLTEAEGLLLYELARRGPPGAAVVEVGSWKGRSTVCLALGARAGGGGAVVAVDPHTGSEEHHRELGAVDTFAEFTENVARAGVGDVVRPVRVTSTQAAAEFDGPVGVVFIDGAHDFASVCDDIEAWLPRVVPGGTVAFHDVSGDWPDVRRAVVTRVVSAGRIDRVRFVHSIVYGRRRDRAGPVARAAARVVLGYKRVVDASRPWMDRVAAARRRRRRA